MFRAHPASLYSRWLRTVPPAYRAPLPQPGGNKLDAGQPPCDSPDVRQSFDATWAAYDVAPWRVAGFASRPVQYSFEGESDDRSNRRFRFGLLQVECKVLGAGSLFAYPALYERPASPTRRAANGDTSWTAISRARRPR